jgi:hypothetical protein
MAASPKQQRNSQFQRGQGVFTCDSCGHRTRHTGREAIGHDSCALCYEAAGIENSHVDNGPSANTCGLLSGGCPACAGMEVGEYVRHVRAGTLDAALAAKATAMVAATVAQAEPKQLVRVPVGRTDLLPDSVGFGQLLDHACRGSQHKLVTNGGAVRDALDSCPVAYFASREDAWYALRMLGYRSDGRAWQLPPELL